jgi:hypothetical protein
MVSTNQLSNPQPVLRATGSGTKFPYAKSPRNLSSAGTPKRVSTRRTTSVITSIGTRSGQMLSAWNVMDQPGPPGWFVAVGIVSKVSGYTLPFESFGAFSGLSVRVPLFVGPVVQRQRRQTFERLQPPALRVGWAMGAEGKLDRNPVQYSLPQSLVWYW